MDKKCKLNPKFEKYVKDGVKFVGNKHVPKWQITAGWKKKSDGSPDLKNGKKQMTVIGEVHCPCHDAGGGRMTKASALSNILGQVSALSVPLHVAVGIAKGETFVGGEFRPMAGTAYKGGPSPPLTGMEIGKMRGVTWNARVALATIKMLRCWQGVCMTKSLMQSRLKALQARLQRLRKKGESAKKDLKKNATEDMDVEGEETVDLYADLDGLLGEVEAHTGAGQEDLFDIEEPAKLASKGEGLDALLDMSDTADESAGWDCG